MGDSLEKLSIEVKLFEYGVGVDWVVVLSNKVEERLWFLPTICTVRFLSILVGVLVDMTNFKPCAYGSRRSCLFASYPLIVKFSSL